jgi:hypothetical protein
MEIGTGDNTVKVQHGFVALAVAYLERLSNDRSDIDRYIDAQPASLYMNESFVKDLRRQGWHEPEKVLVKIMPHILEALSAIDKAQLEIDRLKLRPIDPAASWGYSSDSM